MLRQYAKINNLKFLPHLILDRPEYMQNASNFEQGHQVDAMAAESLRASRREDV
jgi:hypothetical protein